jgi:p-aminobenzoyl-glutamate transporter AbgT
MFFFIICLLIFSGFAAMNVNQTWNINLVVRTYENVNVVISLIIAFAFGVVITLPFAFFKRSQKAKKAQNAAPKLTRAEKKAAKMAQKRSESAAVEAVNQAQKNSGGSGF